MEFVTSYSQIEEQIEKIDVTEYAKTRNYFNGSVSCLSPYISRGVISLPFLKERILQKNTFSESYRFIYELAWREYFQRVWWRHKDEILTDLKSKQEKVTHDHLIKNIAEAKTGIQAVDLQIEQLYSYGYMHNHARMYTASLVCNIGQSHWRNSAKWMYYHLLDGDIASNYLSWQWVAGCFSTKKYYCNQENINTYSKTNQINTFLDHSYEKISDIPVPLELSEATQIEFTTELPTQQNIQLDHSLPLLIYNSHSLDPLWRKSMKANRVLVLEPSHFKKFLVSKKVMDFILELSHTIPDILLWVGEVNDIPYLSKYPSIHSKSHPASIHYPGSKDEVEWMFPAIELQNSFTSFWKACEKTLTIKP